MYSGAETNLFTCSVCLKAKKINIYTVGKSAVNPKKDDISKHASTKSHKEALGIVKGQESLKHAASKSFDMAEESVEAQLATLYMQAKSGIPSVKNSDLVKICLYLPSKAYICYIYFFVQMF